MEGIWGNQLIYRSFWSNYDLALLCPLLLFMRWNCLYISKIVSYITSKWWYHWIGELFMQKLVCHIYLFHDLHQHMCGVNWSIPDFCWFWNPLFWRNIDMDFNLLRKNISWIHDRFIWIVHEIFHAISEIKDRRFCWGINISTDTHGKILKIIASLNSDLHEATNPVIEGHSMWFLNLFQIFYNKRCSHEEYLFKVIFHWERWFLKLYFIFFLCSPIFLNNAFDYMICMVNKDRGYA